MRAAVLRADNLSQSKKKDLTDIKVSYGYLQRRVVAFIIDYFLGSIIISLIPMLMTSITTQETAFTMDNFSRMSLGLRVAGGAMALLMGVLYYVIYPMLPKHPGQTPGKMAAKIKVVRQDGTSPNYCDLFRREILGSFLLEGQTGFSAAYLHHFLYLLLPLKLAGTLVLLSVALSVLSVILAVFTKRHRMLHDHIGGTMVVNIE